MSVGKGIQGTSIAGFLASEIIFIYTHVDPAPQGFMLYNFFPVEFADDEKHVH